MKPVQTVLLFVNRPTLALERFAETLGQRLAGPGVELKRLENASSAPIAMAGSGLRLAVNFLASPMPAESFNGATESPLSAPFRGVLSDIVFRHCCCLTVTVSADDKAAEPADRMTQLRVAHAASTLLAEWHMPAAVHWRQSNQLLVGSQYLRLSGEEMPWALIANARLRHARSVDGMATYSMLLDEAKELVGRPVYFHTTSRPVEQVHAAALAFLRHAATSGHPIPHGHTFGAETDGISVLVSHVPDGPEAPGGRYDLRAVDMAPSHAAESGKPPHGGRRIPDLPSAYTDAATIRAAKGDARDRGALFSLLMLAILPPLGLLLLVTNLLLGASTWRSAVLTMASVTLALAVSAYAFLSYVGQDTAVLLPAEHIESSILPD